MEYQIPYIVSDEIPEFEDSAEDELIQFIWEEHLKSVCMGL